MSFSTLSVFIASLFLSSFVVSSFLPLSSSSLWGQFVSSSRLSPLSTPPLSYPSPFLFQPPLVPLSPPLSLFSHSTSSSEHQRPFIPSNDPLRHSTSPPAFDSFSRIKQRRRLVCFTPLSHFYEANNLRPTLTNFRILSILSS